MAQEKIHCKKCNSTQRAHVLWVKFWKDIKRIDTKFTCQNCGKTQVNKQPST